MIRMLVEIAIPPKYGTGVDCFFLSPSGWSSAPTYIASFRTGHVKKPLKRNVERNKIVN
jgi:hypothetical protein